MELDLPARLDWEEDGEEVDLTQAPMGRWDGGFCICGCGRTCSSEMAMWNEQHLLLCPRLHGHDWRYARFRGPDSGPFRL